MVDQDKPRFAQIMMGLGEYFDKPMSQALLEIYWQGLSDLTLSQLSDAATTAIRTAKFFPRVSELREMVGGGREEAALLAWEQVQEAIARGGYVSSVLFEDSKITRAIEHIGGWVKLCMSEGKDAKFMQKDFLSVYKTLTDGGPQRKLIGADEADNRFLGFTNHIPEPLVIGSEKFLLWHREMRALGRNDGEQAQIEDAGTQSGGDTGRENPSCLFGGIADDLLRKVAENSPPVEAGNGSRRAANQRVKGL